MSTEENSCSTETFDVLEYSGQRDLDPNQVDCFLTSPNETGKDVEVDTQDKLLCQICKLSFVGSNSRHELLEHINLIHSFSIFDKGETCSVCNSVFYTLKAFRIHKNMCHKESESSLLVTSQNSHVIDEPKEETTKSNSENIVKNETLDSEDGIELSNQTTPDSELSEKTIELKPEKCVRKQVPKNSLKCYICSKVFQRTRDFISHVITYHKNEVPDEDFDDLSYRCKKCAVTFPNLILLRGHFFNKHAALIIYRCIVCHVTLRTKKSLRIHYNHFHALKNKELHSCDECGKEFSNLKAIKAHTRLKHSLSNKKQGFRCRICQEKFDTKEKRKLHYDEEHLGESPFICTDCGKGFSSKSGLYGHRQLHKTDQPSTCPYCEKIFNRRDSYHEHILIHVGPRHRCPHCPKEFVQRSNLVRHIRIHTGQKPYACTFCDKRFSDKGACNSHIRVHTKEEQCTCPYCGQTFTKKQKLKYHIRKHTGEGLISCEICSKAFTNAFALKEHRAIHDRQTQTICVECGKAFNSAKYLQRHIALVHHEPQDSSTTLHCPICHKTFYHQTRLKSHLVTHLGKKHLQCLICEKRYSSAKSIRNHLRQSHELRPDQQEFKKSVRSTFENTPISISSLQLTEDLNPTVVNTFSFKKEDNAEIESKSPTDEIIKNENEAISCSPDNEESVRRNTVINKEFVGEISYKDSTKLESKDGETTAKHLSVNPNVLNGHCDMVKLTHGYMNEPLFTAAVSDSEHNSSNHYEVLSVNRGLSSRQLNSDLSAIMEDRIKVNTKPNEVELLPDQVLKKQSKSSFDSCKDISRRKKQLRTPKKYVSPMIESTEKIDIELKNVMPKRERVEAIARSLKASSNLKEIFD